MTRTEYMAKCGECHHYESTTVFDLCKHAASFYTAEGRSDHHTCGHMRINLCGKEARLFQPGCPSL